LWRKLSSVQCPCSTLQKGDHFSIDCRDDTFDAATTSWGRRHAVPLSLLRSPDCPFLDHDRLAIRIGMRVVPPMPAEQQPAGAAAAAEEGEEDEEDEGQGAVLGL